MAQLPRRTLPFQARGKPLPQTPSQLGSEAEFWSLPSGSARHSVRPSVRPCGARRPAEPGHGSRYGQRCPWATGPEGWRCCEGRGGALRRTELTAFLPHPNPCGRIMGGGAAERGGDAAAPGGRKGKLRGHRIWLRASREADILQDRRRDGTGRLRAVPAQHAGLRPT